MIIGKQLLRLATVAGMLTFSAQVLAHGYVTQPASRSLLCAQTLNQQCGAVQWEPQSVEGLEGFPLLGPSDGSIASGSVSHFSELDQQTPLRWHKNELSTGSVTFAWRFTANHASRDFRYYLTKPDWNPSAALTRNSFDLTPFCVVDAGSQRPPMEISHVCQLPEDRDGYHIILGVWDIADTVNAFYQVVDVNINSTPITDGWQPVGSINPSIDLAVGDKVKLRFFDESDEVPSEQFEWVVLTEQQGIAAQWPYEFATALNDARQSIRAGQLINGEIMPRLGVNTVFVPAGSWVTRVETSIERMQPNPISLHLMNVQARYELVKGVANIDFMVHANQPVSVFVELFDSEGNRLAMQQSNMAQMLNIELPVPNAVAGEVSLVIIAQTDDGRSSQLTQQLELYEQTGDANYDYVFPEQLSQYQGGTRVLARDGEVYQCKPFPYEGWCRAYSEAANQYEPGVGAHWQDAWGKR